MTSFADDNRNILNSKKRQYNNSIKPAEQNTAAPQNVPTPRGTVRTSVSSRRKKEPTVSDALYDALERRRAYVKKRNEKIAGENRKKIREAFAAGTTKVDYSYDEYAVSEHNLPVGLVAVAVALTLVAVFLLLNYSQITRYNNRINELESEMAAYNEEIKELDIILDKSADLAAIEEYAAENGMVRSDKIESRHISMADGFVIEKNADTEEEFTISTVMSGVLKLFSEALGE